MQWVIQLWYLNKDLTILLHLIALVPIKMFNIFFIKYIISGSSTIKKNLLIVLKLLYVMVKI